MSQETFLKTVEAIAAIDHLRTSREVTRDKIIDGYTSVISACCDTIKRKDIERMTEPQIAGFLSQIIKQVQGEGHSSNGDEAVKKKLTA